MRSISSYVTGSAQPKLNHAMLNKIPMQVPDKLLLDKFINIIEKVSNLKSKSSEGSKEPLFSSLSQKAFAGEL